MIWCEHCRDHFDVEHYDEDGNHRVGVEYGPTGVELVSRGAVDRLLEVLTPLLDEEFCSAYPSAWELDPHTDWTFPDGTKADGEELHALLVEAVTAVRASVGGAG